MGSKELPRLHAPAPAGSLPIEILRRRITGEKGNAPRAPIMRRSRMRRWRNPKAPPAAYDYARVHAFPRLCTRAPRASPRVNEESDAAACLCVRLAQEPLSIMINPFLTRRRERSRIGHAEIFLFTPSDRVMYGLTN